MTVSFVKMGGAFLAAIFVTVGSAQTRPQVLDPATVFARVSPSIVTIKATYNGKTAQGSAVAIGNSHVNKVKTGTWLATNAHVVMAEAAKVELIFEGKSYPAEIDYIDRIGDIAHIHAPSIPLPPIKQSQAEGLVVGARVFAIGSPLGLDRTLSEGLVSAIREDAGIKLIQTDAAISPGSSGGALVDNQGRLVGITTFKMKGGEALNFAVDAYRSKMIRDSSEAADMFRAVYDRVAYEQGSETEKDIKYIESPALIQWMLEKRRPDGRRNYEWFLEKLYSSIRRNDIFGGGNREFDQFYTEFVATRKTSGDRVATSGDDPGVIRLVCKMYASRDNTFAFDLNIAFNPATQTVNNRPATVRLDSIQFATGRDLKYTATVNRYSMRAIVGYEKNPTLASGACTRVEERKF